MNMKIKSALMLIVLIVLLQACGGGGGGGGETPGAPEVINIQSLDISAATIEGASVQFEMKALDMDTSTLACFIEKNPSHGTVMQISGATWEYTPHEDFSGIDELDYYLSKGTNKSNLAKVRITVEASGNILYVSTSGSDQNSGSSWTEALKHPQEAMNKAVSGEQIWVAIGTYSDTDQDPATPVLAMKDGVRIYGGFSGNELYRSERDITANASILDGQKTVYHVVKGAPFCRVDGFIIKNGNAKINDSIIIDPEETGGGMLNVNTGDTLKISNCSFLNNNAKGYGGGISNQEDSSPKIINCYFTDNNAYYGGAISNSIGTSNIVNCLFQGNNAYSGGAIININASPSMVNCTISGNNAILGGALHNQSSTLDVTNCIIWGNSDFEMSNLNSTTVIRYSCILGGATGTGNIIKNPQFDSPGYRNVGNEWIPGNYRLKDTSPCIDAADGNAAPYLDIVGQVRVDILSVANSGTGLVPYSDMGAYEYMP